MYPSSKGSTGPSNKVLGYLCHQFCRYVCGSVSDYRQSDPYGSFTLNPRPETLNHEPSARNPKP